MQKKNASLKTKQAYEKDLTNYLLYLEKSENITKIQEVTRIHVKNYLIYLKELKRAGTSISRALSAIRSFHYFLMTNKLLEKDPARDVTGPAFKRELPEILSIEEVDCLLSVNVNNQFLNYRNKAMLEVLYATGLKVSELCNLKVEDVQIAFGFIQCRGGKQKRKGNSHRCYC
ncbi:MAG: site-specific integrase [Bacillus sp. (in: Bacteria)]|nr:site-specific integrase [Bacillus sp. (in: firmicutes)]